MLEKTLKIIGAFPLPTSLVADAVMGRHTRVWSLVLLILVPPVSWAQTRLPGFHQAQQFDEQVCWTRLDSGVRIMLNAPLEWRADKRLLVIYATPNGSTIEQTAGCAAAPNGDWKYDIQHVAAQIRWLREIDATRDIVFGIVQAPRLSWPAFRKSRHDANTIIRDLVSTLCKEVEADHVALMCHSGGGSFLFGYMNSVEKIPAEIERIVFLDANYSYSDDDQHGDKLLAWLLDDARPALVVVAYDDRDVTFHGKKVVGPDGGTFRATQRMLDRFRRDVQLQDCTDGSFQHHCGLDGRLQFYVHSNPANKILHTAIVGEMNGVLQGLTAGAKQGLAWGQFGGPRSYEDWIQQLPSVDPTKVRAVVRTDVSPRRLELPIRPTNALTGVQFRGEIQDVAREEREEMIRREICSGNVPDFLRELVPIQIALTDRDQRQLTATCFVTRDYLAVGTDDDFFRLPMSPGTAGAIADSIACSLITPRVSDAIWAAAPSKLDPRPLTQNRESVTTFFQHHQIIERQLGEGRLRELVAGIKKDVVLTNRLTERPHRVAIYGWHYPDGNPIQPIYVGHVDWYVDYSHGIRLMANKVLVESRELTVSQVLQDPRLHVLFSDEGPLDPTALRRAAEW